MKDNNKNIHTKEENINKNENIKNEFGNTNSKEILRNKRLCAQFLRSYTGIPLFEHVKPEDIEDITDSLRPFVGVEYEGDSVIRICLPESDSEIYVVGVIEHKSKVDYDVSFQLLKYMVGIWAMYRNHLNKLKKNSSSLKRFRYPLIIPIVYYEGREKWTAAMHWKDRVQLSEQFGQFVPDFVYKVIELHNYTNEELLAREEELSFVMMLNRVQTEEDLDSSKWSEEWRQAVERIVRDAPKDVLDILAQMVHHLGLKLKLPDEKLMQYVKNVEDRDMGELWAHMDDIDVPKRMRELDEQMQKVKEWQQDLEKEWQDKEKEWQDKEKEWQDKQKEWQRDLEKMRQDEEKKLRDAEKKLRDKEKKQQDAEKKLRDKEKKLREVGELQKQLEDANGVIAGLQAELDRLKPR